MPQKFRPILSLLIILLALPAIGSGCTSTPAGAAGSEFPMTPLHQMPADMQNAPASVRQAYQFAVANPEVTSQLPCYCGCGPIGHSSNYACYVSDVNSSGGVTYDGHALGCSICVDITLDAMRLLKQGKELAEVRVYIDETYSLYGPTNMP
jgi:hypothetical protein